MMEILVVDDHEIVREGLAASLNSANIQVVSAVGSGAAALDALSTTSVDAVIVDLRLPDMSGHELIRHIKAKWPNIKIIVLSTYLSEETVRLSRESGADDYVAKSSGLSELRAALSRLADSVSLDETPADLVRRLRSDGDDVLLTPQQERVVTLAAQGKTDREIAVSLFLSESTVRFHMQRLKEILGARSKTQVIAEAIRRELIRPGPP